MNKDTFVFVENHGKKKKSKADLPDALSEKEISEGKNEKRDEIETILGAEDPADHEGEEDLKRITPEELRQEKIVRAIYAQILGKREGQKITDEEVKGINSSYFVRNFQIEGVRKFYGYTFLNTWGGKEFGYPYAVKMIQADVFKIPGAAEEAEKEKIESGLKKITAAELRSEDIVKSIYGQILGIGDGKEIIEDDEKGINSGHFYRNFQITGFRKFRGETFLIAWGGKEFGYPYALKRIQAEVFRIAGAAEEAEKEKKRLKKITANELMSDDVVKTIYAQILGKGNGEEITGNEVKGINSNHFQRNFQISGFRKFHGNTFLIAWGGKEFGLFYAIKRIQAEVFKIAGAAEEAEQEKEEKGLKEITTEALISDDVVKAIYAQILGKGEGEEITKDVVKGINSPYFKRNFQIAGYRKFRGYTVLNAWGAREFGLLYALLRIQAEIFKIPGAAEEAEKEKKKLKKITREELRSDDIVKVIYAQILGKEEGEEITHDEVKGINSPYFKRNFQISGFRKFHGSTFLYAWGSRKFGFPYAVKRIQAEVFKIAGAAEEVKKVKEVFSNMQATKRQDKEKGLKEIMAADLISDNVVKAIYGQILGKGEGEAITHDEVKGINSRRFKRNFQIAGFRGFHGDTFLNVWGGKKFGYYYAVKRIQAEVFGIAGAAEEAEKAKMAYLEKKGKLKVDFKIILTLPEVASRVSELLEGDENLKVEMAEKRAIEEYLAKNQEAPKKERRKKGSTKAV